MIAVFCPNLMCSFVIYKTDYLVEELIIVHYIRFKWNLPVHMIKMYNAVATVVTKMH